MIERDIETLEDVHEFLRTEKDLFFINLIHCIEDGWNEGILTVNVAKFYIVESGSVMDISIDYADWDETLHLALYHFERKEEYEYCEEINRLITRIDVES